uniref:Uncharacterized protein n=1 Tax=Plectus sambesii TaxID=2011161 RepID=A0A914VFN0_9BILA
MIDCHCHLADKAFDADIDAVVNRAKEAGVKAVLVNTECKEEYQKTLDMAKKYDGFCMPCFGVHPVQYEIVHSVTYEDATDPAPVSVKRQDINGVDEWFAKHHSSLVAVGECGLDFTPRYIKSDDDKAAQREVLKEQIALGKQYDLALNVHSRSAGTPVIDFLRSNGADRVLLHAFSGSPKNAQPAIDAGFYFSIPPSFANLEEKRKLIEKIPIDQLCLETDSPVLGPSKTERNEPANIIISAQWIATVKGLSVEEVVQKTTANALRLFPKLQSLIK